MIQITVFVLMLVPFSLSAKMTNTLSCDCDEIHRQIKLLFKPQPDSSISRFSLSSKEISKLKQRYKSCQCAKKEKIFLLPKKEKEKKPFGRTQTEAQGYGICPYCDEHVSHIPDRNENTNPNTLDLLNQLQRIYVDKPHSESTQRGVR